MSESIDKFTAFPRRQPSNRRQFPSIEKKVANNSGKSRRKQPPTSRGGALARPLAKHSAAKGVPVKRVKTRVPVAKSKGNPPRRIPPSQVHTANSRGTVPARAKPQAANAQALKLKRVRKQPLPGKRITMSRRTRLKPMARTILYGLRLLIVGVGIGAIVGTALSMFDPATRINSATSSSDAKVGQNQSQSNLDPGNLVLTQEIAPLKTSLQSMANQNPTIRPGVFLIDLDDGRYVNVNATLSFPAASTIKIPILVAFFQDVDNGKIRLNEVLTMEKDDMVGGSGNMRNQPAGTTYKALEVADKMMTISDNTATNMLIKRMGGMQALNQRFRSWGLTHTALRNPLPDIEGTNTTSPKDLGDVMAMVSRGRLVSMQSRDRILAIMRQNTRRHLLPTGLGEGATIANKTGYIGKMLGDAGLVDLVTGKRYTIAVMVERKVKDDPSAEKFIKSASRQAFEELSKPSNLPNQSNRNGNSVPVNPMQQRGMTAPTYPTNRGSVPMNTYRSPVTAPVHTGFRRNIPPNQYQQPANQQYHYPYQR